jgi:homoserine O-acetyltransferase
MKQFISSQAAGTPKAPVASSSGYPEPSEADYAIRNFKFASGESLPELRIHYRSLGKPERGSDGKVRNAILILHGTMGAGSTFIRPEFAGELFGPGQPFDARHYFIVLPDGIGHGKSTRPSDGLHARFPSYGYRDMVDAQYRLVTEGLGLNHLRLVLGTSMGGMQTWLWGQRHPDFMDTLMPHASLPSQMSGRNRIWRRIIIDAIRGDPAWMGGEYTEQPPSRRTAEQMLFLMSSNPVLRQREMPTLAKADTVLDEYVQNVVKTTGINDFPTSDTNDILYAVSASHDYDPGPGLEKIRARLLAVNYADDLINPPELGIMEREIGRVKSGRAVLVPMSEATHGHGTYTSAAVWKSHLDELFR